MTLDRSNLSSVSRELDDMPGYLVPDNRLLSVHRATSQEIRRFLGQLSVAWIKHRAFRLRVDFDHNITLEQIAVNFWLTVGGGEIGMPDHAAFERTGEELVKMAESRKIRENSQSPNLRFGEGR